jgi:tetratricopeptide (TPR) repeat protein
MDATAVGVFVSALVRARLDAEKRLKRRLSARYLASELDVSDKSVYAYFNGTTVPENLVFERLLDILEIDGADRDELAALRDNAELSKRRERKPGEPAARPVPRELPRFPGGFVERTDALRSLGGLLSAYDSGDESATVVCISGGAGVGKTTLAIAWAHRIASRFTDGQMYVDLRGFDPTIPPIAPSDVLRRFLESCGAAPATLPAGVDELAARYRTALAGRRMLILLDNAYDSEQVLPLIPSGPGCLVLVTSRVQLGTLVAREHARPVVLDVMDRPEAVSLVATWLGAERVAAEADAVAELVDRCARLPLALAVASSRAALNPRLPLRGLTAELRNERRHLEALNAGDGGTDVQAVFAVSYRRLSEPAARLFRLLGLHPGWDFGTPAAAALAAVTVDRAGELLTELTRTYLLDEHRPGRFARHDLLRAYAAQLLRSAGAEERSAALLRMLSWHLHVATEAGRAINPGRRRRPLRAAPFPEPRLRFDTHDEALRWCEEERANLVAVTQLAVDRGENAIAWQLPLALVDYFDRRKHWADWIAINEIALTGADRDGDAFGRATTRNSLGVANRELGRLDDALRHYAEALEIFSESDDSYATAMLLTNLGNINTTVERYEAAVDFHGRALALFRKIENSYGEALALENLGHTYAQSGRLDDALEHQERALEICREISDRTGEAATLDSLGETLSAAGKVDEAIDRHRMALPIRREVGDRYGEMITLVNLGDVLHDTEDHDEAHALWADAARIADDLSDPQAERIYARLDGCTRPEV